MTFEDLVSDVVGRLNDAGIAHMLTGSVASSWYGEPRATQDLDVVIDPAPTALDQLIDGLLVDRWHVDLYVAHAALDDRTRFNAIGPEAFKVDFIIRHDRPFSRAEFDRRQPVELLGTKTFLPTVEDMVIARLEWAQATDSERQRRDVQGMLVVAGSDIDLTYVDGWVRRLGLGGPWEALRAR